MHASQTLTGMVMASWIQWRQLAVPLIIRFIIAPVVPVSGVRVPWTSTVRIIPFPVGQATYINGNPYGVDDGGQYVQTCGPDGKVWYGKINWFPMAFNECKCHHWTPLFYTIMVWLSYVMFRAYSLCSWYVSDLIPFEWYNSVQIHSGISILIVPLWIIQWDEQTISITYPLTVHPLYAMLTECMQGIDDNLLTPVRRQFPFFHGLTTLLSLHIMG